MCCLAITVFFTAKYSLATLDSVLHQPFLVLKLTLVHSGVVSIFVFQ